MQMGTGQYYCLYSGVLCPTHRKPVNFAGIKQIQREINNKLASVCKDSSCEIRGTDEHGYV